MRTRWIAQEGRDGRVTQQCRQNGLDIWQNAAEDPHKLLGHAGDDMMTGKYFHRKAIKDCALVT
eukprot:scaffold494321_cov21-Prasinocladus_malaysianus.AAC.1